VMPVDRLSYSSLTQLLRNPLIFKLKHVLGVYNSKTGISGMIGRAGHEALKVYYGGHPDISTPMNSDEARELAIDHGMKYLNEFPDMGIRYGKTGSRESMLKAYTTALQFYFAEEPTYNNILICEEKLEAEIKSTSGSPMPIPVVAVPDLVDECADKTIDIIDTKFVKTFTKYEDEDGEPYEDYIKIIQAKFLDRTLKASKGLSAKRVVFREVKYTKNKDENEPQIRDYVIPLDHQQYDIIFDNIFLDAVKFLSNPNTVYLPNLSDTYDGNQAGELYAMGLLSSDMSDVEVMHKVKDVALVSKRFVPSRIDRIENKHLNPEEKIKLRLAEFGIPVQPVETKVGASVTQYRFKVSAGIRMTTILKHKADVALAIEAKGEINIIAPIPGTNLIGVEVPNQERNSINLEEKHLEKDTLSIPIGVDIHGNVVKVPLNEMPHLLIAGATGTGKSVLLHATLTALTKQMHPDHMNLVLIDPKRVELVAFSKTKHLKGSKIIYKYPEAIASLQVLVNEMEWRYGLLEKSKSRDIDSFNKKGKVRLPYIVVVIDEFADLMMQGKIEERKKKTNRSMSNAATRAAVETIARQMAKQGIIYKPKVEDEELASAEELITRLAQMARAVGIHLIIATQRPSVDVITGLIKANFPTRIAMTTASATDSKVILGEEGAEKLNGKGDMILMTPSRPKVRLQGFMI